MKIKDFCKRMNDHGTYPHIIVFKHSTLSEPVILYDDNPYGVPAEIEKLSVNSFTVFGAGFVAIHTD